MADTESLGEAGVRWLEGLAAASEHQRLVRVPTITDPRGTDFAKAAFLGQNSAMLDLERRAISAFIRLGVAMTDTCINYQTIQAPTRNEHVAFGDTGVVIYSNSVCGARSNFEGGPSALAAGLTARTPRYGFHLPGQRRATLHVRVERINLEGFRGVRPDQPGPLLDLISEQQLTVVFPGQFGRLEDLGRVYRDSQQPVWTAHDDARHGAFAASLIGRIGDLLNAREPLKLAERLKTLRDEYEASAFGSVTDPLGVRERLERFW
jgi:hypothetical protein